MPGKECYVEYQPKYKWIYLYSAVALSTRYSFILLLLKVNIEMINLFLEKFQEHIDEKDIVFIMDNTD